MGPAHYVVMALRAIGVLMLNPALGGGSQLRAGKIRTLTEMLANLVEGAEAAYDELKQFAVEVEALAASNQSPSRAQWDALVARDRAARDAIAANRRAVEERIAERERLKAEEETRLAAEAEETARLKAEEETRLATEAEETARLEAEKSLNPGGDPPNSADQ